MKKNIKRLVAVLMVMAMIISMCSTAFAAGHGSKKSSQGSYKSYTKEVTEDTSVTDPVVESAETTEDQAVDETAETPEETVVSEEDIVYPALERTGSTDDIDVSISAPEGALPEGTDLSVSTVEASEVEEAVASVMDEDVTDVYALDISFVNDEEEVEPAEGTEVEVTLTSDLLKTEETPNIIHIKDDGEAELVNAVINKEEGTAIFKAGSFSTFTVTWGNNNSNSVTIHHGIMQNGSFVEFGTSNLPSTSNTNYPSSLRWADYDNNDYAVLIYDFADYSYSATYYRANTSSTPATGGTAIWPALQKRNDTGSNNDNWRYCNANRTSWSRDGACANNSHIYVIYTPKTITTGYDPSSDGDDSGTPSPSAFTPDVGKNVTDQKDDGTYDITLGFVGNKESTESKTTARVIVVFDLSGSMNYNMSGGSSTSATNPSRLTLAKNAVNKLAETLLALEDSQGNKLVEMGLVTFATDGRIRTFGTGTNASTFTSNYETYSGVITNLPISSNDNLGTGVNDIGRGTNWEKGLDLANSMATSTAGKTYIVFVSDGDPTYRVSRGSYSDEVVTNEMTFSRVTIPIFGNGSGNYDRNYNTAREVAKSIVDHNKTFYAVGLSSDATRMTNLATYSGGIYKAGNNADEFAASLADIAGSISSEIGLTDMTITDGVTSMSHIETQSLIGTAGNFTYNKSYPLTQGTTGYTYTIGETTYNITQAQVDAGTDGTHKIFSRTVSGATVYYVEYPWDIPEGAEAAIDENNAVVWDTSAANSELEHGVYYSVTFTVWPKQEAYDLIADLQNGIVKVTDATLAAGTKAQLRVLVDNTTYEYDTTTNTWTGGLSDAQLQALVDAGQATFSMKTNTGLSASYKYGGVEQSANYTNYTNGNMTLDSTTFSIHKNWVNQLPQDSRTAQVLTKQDEDGKYYLVDGDGEWILDDNNEKIEYDTSNPSSWKDKAVYYIDLIVTKDNGEYEEVRLLSSDDWRKDNIFISLGVISEENGTLIVRETGHEYSVTEKPSDAYYWELTSYTYRPMVINGVTTMLQKIDEDDANYDAANALDDNTSSTISGIKYYKFGGGIYKSIDAEDALMEATNNRRSYLNLTKVVDGTNVPADALFEYKITITDPNEEDLWFSAYDPVSESTVMDLEVTGATAEAGNTGYWYVPSGQEFTIKIKAGWNVRFTNLMSTTTYEIEEVTTSMDDGFVFDSVEATAELDGDAQTYEPEIEDAIISGEIEAPNTDYTVTYTNDYLGNFYVYHSSDNTIERIPMAEGGEAVTTFNIYAKTKADTLYGGYYDGYEGADATDEQINETAKTGKIIYTEGIGEDTDGTPYDYAYIKSSSKAAWNTATAYTTSGKAMTPESGEVYYLKEVPTGYLQPYTYYTYYTADEKIADMWAISGLDDLNYTDAGFYIVDVKTQATNVVSTLSIKAQNSSTTVKLTATKAFVKKGVKDGYLSYAKISDKIGKEIMIQQYWTTPDDIEVFGTMQRKLNTTDPVKSSIVNTDTPYETP